MSILERIKQDSRYVFENADFVELNINKIDELVSDVLTDEELKKWINHGDETEAVFGKSRVDTPEINYKYSIPIEIRDRINLLSILDLINFASGFRFSLFLICGLELYLFYLYTKDMYWQITTQRVHFLP